MDTIPKYRSERRPFTPDSYNGYLALYGHVYGDMSDPVKRADTVAALRRRDALVQASACRSLRAMVAETDTDELVQELRVKRYQLDECGAYRGWSVRNADIHQLRMIINELKCRGEI